MENIIFVKTIPLNQPRQRFIVLPNSVEAELTSGQCNDREGNPHLSVFVSIMSEGKIICKYVFFVHDEQKERFEKNLEDIMDKARKHLSLLMVRTLSFNLTSNYEGTVAVLHDTDIESIRCKLVDYVWNYIDENYKETCSEPQSSASPSSKDSSTQKKRRNRPVHKRKRHK